MEGLRGVPCGARYAYPTRVASDEMMMMKNSKTILQFLLVVNPCSSGALANGSQQQHSSHVRDVKPAYTPQRPALLFSCHQLAPLQHTPVMMMMCNAVSTLTHEAKPELHLIVSALVDT